MSKSLINKYNIAGPRYTSYPTVPYWDVATFSLENWKMSLKQAFEESNSKEGISLYIHLPYCESLCTFCGCNKRITKQHGVEPPYINAVLKNGVYIPSYLMRSQLLKNYILEEERQLFLVQKI